MYSREAKRVDFVRVGDFMFREACPWAANAAVDVVFLAFLGPFRLWSGGDV